MKTLIIGGSKGLGKAVARCMPGEVFTICRTGCDFSLDLSDESSIGPVIKQAVIKMGNIDNLIFCQRYRGTDEWSGEIDVTLKATKLIIEAISPHMNEGSIVIVNSPARSLVVDQPISYHVAKAGLDQITRYYAVELGRRKIRVNAVAPDVFIKDESTAFYNSNPELKNLYSALSPLGRMVHADEVALTIRFLCSKDASAITGQTIVIDAGISLRGHATLSKELNRK